MSGASLLVVSQFTLLWRCGRKGTAAELCRRGAAGAKAERMYGVCCRGARAGGDPSSDGAISNSHGGRARQRRAGDVAARFRGSQFVAADQRSAGAFGAQEWRSHRLAGPGLPGSAGGSLPRGYSGPVFEPFHDSPHRIVDIAVVCCGCSAFGWGARGRLGLWWPTVGEPDAEHRWRFIPTLGLRQLLIRLSLRGTLIVP